ncbi:MAG: hypothetical protein E7609_03305 [Ruminococcaceae bacterium]|nr:hypothetical protein [Oscillospiraceae bacterium]
MKKKLLFPCLLLTAVMIISCIVTLGVGAEETKTMTAVAGGEAVVAGDVVTIANEAELKAFSLYVSEGGVTEGVTFRLTADIALETKITGSGFNKKTYSNLNPIGSLYNGASAVQPFKGIFDGAGHTISNLYVTERNVAGTSMSGAAIALSGLFAKIDGGTVKDLVVTVGSIQKVGSVAVGAIAAEATNATILNCSVKAEVSTATQISGLSNSCPVAAGVVGFAKNSVIDGCSASLKVTGVNKTAGIVGVAEDTAIRNCVVSGTYSHTAASAIGGVAAELTGTSSVKNCYSSVTLSSSLGKDALGGVVGIVGENAIVENCFSNAVVTAPPEVKYGSLVGINNGTVKHSYGLRDASLAVTVGYADIGEKNGTVENVFAFQPKTEGDKTTFVVGTVVFERKEEGGVYTDTYTFVPAEGDTDLVAELNAWVNENKDATYAAWMVSGTTIVNCKHDARDEAIKLYPDQKPTCSSVGHGDLVCACGLVKEVNVEVPVDPNAHSGRIFECLDYTCKYCNEVIEAEAGHLTDNIPCQDQTCRRCNTFLPATQGHEHPDDFDEEAPACAEYECKLCHEKTRDEEHDIPDDLPSCKDATCTLCGETVKAKEFHDPGRAANCTRAQKCLVCNETIEEALGHRWGDPATCGVGQLCTVCNAENPDAPATGAHVYNREAATCVDHKRCVNCNYIGEQMLGHAKNSDHRVSCGSGISCTRCSRVLETATNDHNVNWAMATVIRVATAERTGIVVGVCADCNREVEAYTTYAVMEDVGNAMVFGGNFTFYAGSRVNAVFGKAADYKDIAFADGYLPLQAVTLSVVDAAGASVGISGNVTVKVVLNKSVVKMASNTIKLYQVNGTTATEVAISSVADGFITFDISSMGTFVLAGEETAAFTVLGSLPVQAQQTAALVGTPSYDRRDFEI